MPDRTSIPLTPLAIKVYTNCGFVSLSDDPIPDPLQGGQSYIVMTRRVSIAQA